jgi:hypothetical protein
MKGAMNPLLSVLFSNPHACHVLFARGCVLLTGIHVVLMQVHIKSQWTKINGKLMVKKCDPHTLT